MIYILRTDGGPETFYKVGYTKREMSKRIKALQTGCPYKLQLVQTMQGSQEKERELHSVLKRSRIHGEWYKDDFYVRETLGIYDWKGFPHKEFEPTHDQARIIEFFKSLDSPQYWFLGDFLKAHAIDEHTLRTIPFGKRNFGLGLFDHDLLARIGTFHGEPFKGKFLCIGGRE